MKFPLIPVCILLLQIFIEHHIEKSYIEVEKRKRARDKERKRKRESYSIRRVHVGGFTLHTYIVNKFYSDVWQRFQHQVVIDMFIIFRISLSFMLSFQFTCRSQQHTTLFHTYTNAQNDSSIQWVLMFISNLKFTYSIVTTWMRQPCWLHPHMLEAQSVSMWYSNYGWASQT